MPSQVGSQRPLCYCYFPLYVFSSSLVSADRLGCAQTRGFLRLYFYWSHVLAVFGISRLGSFISIQTLGDVVL